MQSKSERKCVGCNEMKPKNQLIRVVITENGPAIDEKQNINARGAYLCKSESCLAMAKKCRGFSRSFKKNIPDTIFEEILKSGEING